MVNMLGSSFMKSTNNKRPSIELWGTSQVAPSLTEIAPTNDTHWNLFL